MIRRVAINKRVISVGIMCLLVFGGFVGFVNFEAKNAQGTFVSGPITTDIIWNKALSPYIVVGDVWVEVDATLTIDPGVEVKFDGYYSVYVNGTIIAIGTETDRVIITSNMIAPDRGDWNNLQINSVGHAEVKYCNITYGFYGIHLDSSSNNNITDNDISNNSVGFLLNSSSNNRITNNYISDNWGGILLWLQSNDNTITNNIFLNNSNGIRLDSSSNNNITDNDISNNSNGIYLDLSSNNKITDNNISNNSDGIHLDSSSNNNITNNTVFSNGIASLCGIFLEKSLNNYIGNNDILFNFRYGIWLYRSLNNIIANNNILNNFEDGIRVWFDSLHNTIINNIISSNLEQGIDLGQSSNNRITNNYISDNSRGIYLWAASNDNTITNNIVLNNLLGISLGRPSSPLSFNNMIYHNNIIGNVNQSYDNTSNGNQWDNGYPEGGNYWSDFDESGEGAFDDYSGSDQNVLGSDGIVDKGLPTGGKNPYAIDSDSQDNYPLLNPLDNWPPTIMNLQPPDTSTTNDNTPTISADYYDPSGIDVSSVVLEVDGVDVTSFAMVTVSDVNYIPSATLSDGIHTIYLEVKDIYGNSVMKTWSFTVDTTPPITTINPNNYTVKLGSLFTLMATDGITGSGVSFTQYKIDDGPWIDYSVSFSIDTYGYQNISYRSVDNLGNTENEKTLSIYVPEVPVTTIIVGLSQYGTTPRYVNQFTQFSFSVIDYSGLGYDTYYYIDSAPLILYNEPFTVVTEGTHTIYYYSFDKVGNIEDTKQIDIIVDNTPPTTTIALGDPYYFLGDTCI
jgi:parallel beta-helix repeat protein